MREIQSIAARMAYSLLKSKQKGATTDDFQKAMDGMGARLAVLSACETGVTDMKNADEVIGLPSGLVQAGVAGVAASLWPVSDRSTMMLMGRFYELWRKDGVNPHEALRQAQIWVRDSSADEKLEYCKELGGSDQKNTREARRGFFWAPERSEPEARDFTHPYYWAAFQYVGV
ncbi:MAG: CHAT domain-containing protein [bacterium]|nr:CHAT domain-containing protein [bacterium]